MGVGAGFYMYDVVVKCSRSLSHLLMSSYYCLAIVTMFVHTYFQDTFATNIMGLHALHALKIPINGK